MNRVHKNVLYPAIIEDATELSEDPKSSLKEYTVRLETRIHPNGWKVQRDEMTTTNVSNVWLWQPSGTFSSYFYTDASGYLQKMEMKGANQLWMRILKPDPAYYNKYVKCLQQTGQPDGPSSL